MAELVVSDQLGTAVKIQFPPRRIVSLVPSQTELLYNLGLDNEVVGITRYCIHPADWLHTKAVVGGTKNFDIDTISALQPDLIIGNKEENYEDGIALLRQRFPVWVSDILNLGDALSMIRSVGSLCDRNIEAVELAARISSAMTTVKARPHQRALYLIWRKPFMAAGTETFINEMLVLNGLLNVASGRYPELSSTEVVQLNPDIVLLSSEPYPFREKHIKELADLLPQAKVMLVDGEMFSWYGSRLLHAPGYFNTLEF